MYGLPRPSQSLPTLSISGQARRKRGQIVRGELPYCEKRDSGWSYILEVVLAGRPGLDRAVHCGVWGLVCDRTGEIDRTTPGA